MSHGYIDDIPGHAEFWRRFKCADYLKSFCKKNILRYRLLLRLWQWNRNIRKLKKVYPDKSIKRLENELVYLETDIIVKSVMQ